MRIAAFISCFLLLFTALKYPENPPPAHTGGFGEPSCHTCHFDGEINEGDGSLVLLGLSEGYRAGKMHNLEVVLTRPGMQRAGFQLSARFTEGTLTGTQAGRFVVAGDQWAVDTENAVEYAHHTGNGTALSEEGKTKWTLQWEAPVNQAPIVFHLVANAANGDDSEFGDDIFLSKLDVNAK